MGITILHTVETYLPDQNGMTQVVKQISEFLAESGYDVTVATGYSKNRKNFFLNGVKIVQFNISGNYVTGYKGSDVSKYRDFISNSNFDIITNFAAQHWATDICFDILPQLKSKKVFVPTGFSALNNNIYKGYFEKMKNWMKYYDMNVFLSNNYRDINFARENEIDNKIVIPNGASYKEFSTNYICDWRERLGLGKDTLLFLHVGSYTSMKGHDEALSIYLSGNFQKSALVFVGDNFHSEEALWFLTRINWIQGIKFKSFKTPRAFKQFLRFIRARMRMKNKKVFFLSLPRHELISLYHEADIFLFPSLIECSPIVLFESVASKTPFLVSEVGNAREIIEWTGGGFILPTTIDKNGLSRIKLNDSVIELENLLRNRSKLKHLGEKGYSAWKESYTWEKICTQYLMLYNNLLKS